MRAHLTITTVVMSIAFLLLGGAVAGIGVLANNSIDQGHKLHLLIEERHQEREAQEREKAAQLVAKEKETAEHQRNAAINRAVNVETWCEGNTPRAASLNGIVRHDSQFVRTVSQGRLSYNLSANNCLEIIKQTLEASTHKAKITAATHPLVYRALAEDKASGKARAKATAKRKARG